LRGGAAADIRARNWHASYFGNNINRVPCLHDRVRRHAFQLFEPALAVFLAGVERLRRGAGGQQEKNSRSGWKSFSVAL
jgi:hypothetical protein